MATGELDRPGGSVTGCRERTNRREQARQLTDRALEQLAEALEQGKSECLRRYLRAMGRFHRYSFGNVLLIAIARPEATHVAGFQTWKKLGRHVCKGEKGIMILAPIVSRRRREGRSEARRQAEEEDDEDYGPVVAFKAAHVFDISQTDGKALPEFAAVSGDPAEHTERLREFALGLGIQLRHQYIPGGAQGASAGGTILLRPGLEPAEEFSTLVHEVAHELLHQGDGRPESRTVRETEAETVAFVVCEAVGLQANGAAADYIQLYQGDSKTLAESLERIQRTASMLIEEVKG